MTVQSQTQARRLSTCHRHPSTPITGFCASCLRERLAGIEAAANQEAPSGSRIPSGSELRRSKSCSGRKSDNFSNPPDAPRRRSCDVRARSGNNNSLWRLFNLDDERRGAPRKFEVELGNLGFELKEEDENENESEIRISENVMRNGGDQADEEGIELKKMKEFIDLEWRRKKGGTARDFKDIAGTFWEAASGLSKRLAKWRRKTKKIGGGGEDGGVSAVEKRCPRRPRETQSEIGEYGLGRRSCDADPRLSVDAGRMSLDDYRYSFDEPRASWDGYLMGRAAYPRLSPMLSVVEDAKFSDGEAENWSSSNGKRSSAGDGERSPGGSAQTKDYYSESLSRRRRSFDCPNSLHRKGLLAEVDDLKPISNAKVSPATMELFYGAKLLITDRDLRDAKLKSVKDESLESAVECASKEAAPAIPIGVDQKGLKKSQGWHKMWNLWSPKQRHNERKCRDGGGLLVGGNVGDDSWNKLRVANGEANGAVSQKLIRSYSVSCRNHSKMAGLLSNASGGVESKGNLLKSREEFMLQRNRSARYSPSNIDNGLLRFYLTPLRSHRRTQSGKSRLKSSHSTAAKNVL
ncbi:hypothetical protein L484_022069 [Morus notabilis]|uniref:Uncharacterized protein n=1 Tax=Morus notabilis TaxID=981085 RepID=W9RXF8_9ROSA|nr:UPF0503 protein At3g09070, chloroplastic [Morus notabilis]EXC01492.1 hypothetical protein L484_022069 [Morus notabilis]